MKHSASMAAGVLMMAALAGGCGGPRPVDGLVARAVNDLQIGQIDRAKATLKIALAHRPADPDALFYMGRIYHAEKFYEQAIYYYQCCLDAHPGYVAARKHLAEAMKQAGPIGEALRFIPEPADI